MEYTRLGTSGLVVSRIALGCMTFGVPDRGAHPWTLPEDASRPLLRQAVEAGITLFDTANIYSDGTSEEILGHALADFTRREEVVVATKVSGRMHDGPKGSGLSRGAIFAQIDASLTRLGMDYVDLYQIHRWDRHTPIEETMEALHDVVKAGKARYIGASSMWAWQFAKAQYVADLHGWTRFVSMQDQYNLIQREEEREMYPLCADQGVGVLPWSPLARGRLTREWGVETSRTRTDVFGRDLYTSTEDADRRIAAAVAEVAEAHGVSRAQVAIAWVLGNPVVSAPIVGAGSAAHLEDAVAAVALDLSEDERACLEAPYTPRLPVGF